MIGYEYIGSGYETLSELTNSAPTTFKIKYWFALTI